MFNLVKDSVSDVLRTVGYRVVSVPKDKPCGFNFSEDIRRLVVDEASVCNEYGTPVSLHNFAMGSQNTDQEFINYEDPLLSSFLPLDQNPNNNEKVRPSSPLGCCTALFKKG